MRSVNQNKITRFRLNRTEEVLDYVVVEEPLEIFLNDSREAFLVTMRTPGQDHFLTLGLLYSMGMIGHDPNLSFTQTTDNQVRIRGVAMSDEKAGTIHQYSSCGLCNRPSWDDVSIHSNFPVYDRQFKVKVSEILKCNDILRDFNDDFEKTGGNHKVVFYNPTTGSKFFSEDVGRHNAFDKVVGQCISEKLLPLSGIISILSGRCSYEMCQKSWLAGIPIIVSLGAPTSKAIELAENSGVTLIGFLKENSFNIYSHAYRISHE